MLGTAHIFLMREVSAHIVDKDVGCCSSLERLGNPKVIQSKP